MNGESFNKIFAAKAIAVEYLRKVAVESPQIYFRSFHSDVGELFQARTADEIFKLIEHIAHLQTGGGHITSADLIKKQGRESVLFYNPMERDEAAKTGLQTKNLAEYDFPSLLIQSAGDQVKATAKRYQLMFNELGITSGRVAIYGRVEIGVNYAVFSALQQQMPALQLVGELNNSVLMLARMTKDQERLWR